jgi:hypothetical protein
MSKRAKPEPTKAGQPEFDTPADAHAFRQNWENACDVCDELPTVGDSGLCGSCCFGEADTAGGEW